MKWNPPFLNHEKCNDKNNRTFGDPIRRQTATDSGTGSQKGGPGEGEGARAEGGCILLLGPGTTMQNGIFEFLLT